MIRVPILLVSLTALAAISPATAAPALRDFQLPSSTPTPTPNPRVQGPIDTEGPVVVRPRVIPTDTPTPTPTQPQAPASAPEPAPTPTQRLTLPQQSAPSPIPTARGTAPTAQGTPAPATDITPATDGATSPAASTLPALPPASIAMPPAPPAASPESEGGFALWPWLLALIAALGAGGWFFWRGRQEQFAGVPQIELPPVAPRAKPDATPAARPRPAPLPTPTPAPAAAQRTAATPLALDAIPVHLSRSMMNATFAYRLTLANRGDRPLENVAIGADLVTAHSSVPVEQQISRGDVPLPEMGRVASIAPGEQVEVSGELRLPISAIRTVRQGKAQLYVPLLRVRASAPGVEASARTFVVGTLPPEGGRKLQPFRLDEIPQTYRSIGTMALD